MQRIWVSEVVCAVKVLNTFVLVVNISAVVQKVFNTTIAMESVNGQTLVNVVNEAKTKVDLHTDHVKHMPPAKQIPMLDIATDTTSMTRMIDSSDSWKIKTPASISTRFDLNIFPY